ncbi:MAG: phosphoribosylanthranilate isomerase [Deltaproteobacteria bacterium]
MVKVKICGITNLEDAKTAAGAGCDAIGFVFSEKSPRYITPTEAKLIAGRLPKKTMKVGVFVNARETTVRRIMKECRLDILQFHGNESPEFCGRFKGVKVVKAFRIKGPSDTARVSDYDTFGYLFDSFSPAAQGGTGKIFDWSLAAASTGTGKVFFLSGGLDAGNVRQAIAKLKPQWVDVSSGVENAPGKKDPARIREFMRAVDRG